jgi:hypothetical protein
VGRNSVNFAPARVGKSFAAHRLACGSEAKLSRFRPGGGAISSPGGALFVRHVEAGRIGAQNSLVVRTCSDLDTSCQGAGRRTPVAQVGCIS